MTGSPRPTLRDRIDGILRRAYWRHLFPPLLRWRTYLRAGRHHVAPIDPLRPLAVDPRSIDRWVDMQSADYRRIRYTFGVRDGDWDLDTSPLSEHFVVASLEARYLHGVPWEATEIYAIATRGIREGTGIYHGCRSLADLTRRLEKLDALHEQLRRDGYRSQRELLQRGEALLLRNGHRPPELDEVVVHIDRAGGFILVDGAHRFSLARLLGLESIPVIVLHRHARWQARRDEHARAGHPAADAAHPDLAPAPYIGTPRAARTMR